MEVAILRQTRKAIQAKLTSDEGAEPAWLPKSQLGEMSDYDFTDGEVVEIEVPNWLLDKVSWA